MREKLNTFLKQETTPGLVLMAAAILALLANNSVLRPLYDAFLTTPVEVQIGALEIAKPLLLWVNDGLMAIFFFLVGLEIKREALEGNLSSLDRAALPLFAAVGGMLVPALIYVGINWSSPDTMRGWAIPAATDIAFALGILALMGTRAPIALKVFLLAVAIIDDLGAILIIALFYTADLSLTALGYAGIFLVGLIVLNRLGVKGITPYALLGIAMWVCVLKSGVHATLAGVLTALAIPMAGKSADAPSPLKHVEHWLHPWSAFLVLPLFAFSNAGIALSGLSMDLVTGPVPLGIALGLVIGKPLGVMLFSWLGVRTGLARLPEGVGWLHLLGVSCLTGIGFTMSLFIGSLAFGTPEMLNMVRIGVLGGSILAGTLGVIILLAASALAHRHKGQQDLSPGLAE